jgi:hypothetical protein
LTSHGEKDLLHLHVLEKPLFHSRALMDCRDDRGEGKGSLHQKHLDETYGIITVKPAGQRQ